MLVDDHPLFVEGLQYLLETNNIKVAGIANNGHEALKKARSLKPDIILMDIMMPECGGLEALKLIKAEMPEIKVVMLTTSEEDEDLFEAIKSGASGYLLKSLNAAELLDMIANLKSGGAALSPGLAARLLKEFSRSRNDSNDMAITDTEVAEDNANQVEKKAGEEAEGIDLTERQLDVLRQVAGGKTYKEIGEALGLSERTVKYHMGRIIELLHLENRAQVIAYASRMGLTDDTEQSSGDA